MWTIGRAACTPTTSATLGSWMRRITSRTLLRAPSSSALHRSSPACGGRCSASAPPMCTRCFARPPRPRRRGSGARAGPHHMRRGASCLHFHPPPPLGLHRRARRCSPPAVSRAYLAGGDCDGHDAVDAGGVAAGFDFGDAARMAAEFAPVLRPRRGPRRAASPLGCAHARTRTRMLTLARMYHVCCDCSLLLPCRGARQKSETGSNLLK